MLLLSLENVAQSFAGRDIFTGVNFEVQAGEKLAIVGPNGVGKSSLLRIIAGIDQTAAGAMKNHAGTSCGLLTQYFDDAKASTVLEGLEQAGMTSASYRSVGEALKKFAFIGREDQLITDLSGGEKTRLQLARIWLSGAELLLLDEPSNHLDTENLEWLEGFIGEYPETVIVVSHDRYFLDRTVNRVLELKTDGITSYAGDYSYYYQAKLEQLTRDEKTFGDQQKQSRKLKNAIQEQKVWAGQAHDRAAGKAADIGIKSAKVFYRAKAKKIDRRVKNNIKRLERLEEERIARPHKERTIDLSFTMGRRGRKEVLGAEGIAKAFNTRSLFAGSKFSLKYGEKAALVGLNGSGKTTLLRIIAGLEALDNGEIWSSPSLRLGYLEQEMQSLSRKRSILDELLSICPDQGRVRNLLADLLITGDAVFKPCGVLSMGERVRVALAKLLLGTYDLLLLDEP
ncbi:MAG: ATP-binding cassette domain-containing protein, partial [Syntrophomonadaceae bacterium]|nr:ATP-binding cassette domain-containing protein [Syntrophomonadaceae bacterium]